MTAEADPRRLRTNIASALVDDELRGAVRRATDLFSERRERALAEVPDWQDLRTRARAIKDEALADLDGVLARFVAQAQAAGVVVHHAADAAAARAQIAAILDAVPPAAGAAGEGRGALTVVKSKSMTTEEIHLNQFLEAEGWRPVETDLGEWIIQLAEERPSHIIVPAIHKTRAQIAELFAARLQCDPDLDAGALTAVARGFLRDRFARADVGITGANFAIAETGSVLLLENEGNIRMTTTLPRVHIALVGIEKVLPRLADLAVFLRLLPRSGTGQHLTSYQSLLTGPAATPSADGPREVHVVLLDNGRRRIHADPMMRSTLACIRCGACLNACPVYQQIGGHAYGSVYPGPIGAILTPQLDDGAGATQMPFASSLCGACLEVCPVKIDIPELLLQLRHKAKAGRGERLGMRGWALFMGGERRLGWSRRGLRVLQGVGVLSRVPPLRTWLRGRRFRGLAARPFRDRWPGLAEVEESVTQRIADVASPTSERVEETAAPIDGFVAQLVAAGGQARVLSSPDDLPGALLDLLGEPGGPEPLRVACSDAALAAALPARVEVLAADAGRQELLAADFGLTTAQWGVSETGTLVLDEGQERSRMASLLPPVHVAVLSARRLLPRLEDLFEALAPRAGEAMPAVTLVTGPSRTADIELTLVVGVHGPARLHVLLVP